MNNIIRTELKKSVSKPGLYVLAILLAAILVLGVFIYKPTAPKDNSIALTKQTVLENCTEFYGDASYGYKLQADTEVSTARASLNAYTIDGVNYKTKIATLQDNFKKNFDAYKSCAYIPDFVESYVQQTKNNMLASLTTLYDTIKNGLDQNSTGAYPIVTTKTNYDNLADAYAEAKDLLSQSTINKDKIADICNEYTLDYAPTLEGCIKKLYYPTVSQEKVKDYTLTDEGTKYATLQTRLNKILTDIEAIKAQAQTDNDANVSPENIAKLEKLVNSYANTSSTYANLIKYDLLNSALIVVNTADKANLLYLENTTQLDTKSWLSKYQYLFKSNTNLADYANPLTIGVSSNTETNGYDYAYFSLKLFSFVIIAYAIMAGVHTISGEIKEGTIRYLAIRPVKRNSILLGKLIAISILSLILIIFSGVISLIVGASIYGLNSATILTVFAGKYAITLHPIAMILIFMLSLFLELLVYLSIAMLFSTLFKSDILAVTILLVVYLINILLPIFSTSQVGWLGYYPFSHISLYALFGSSLNSNGGILNLLFGAKVYATSSPIITILTICLLFVVCLLASINIFKRKEI